jgi:TolB protein
MGISKLCFTLALLIAIAPRLVSAQGDERKYTVISGTGQSLYRIAIPQPLLQGDVGAAAKSLNKVLSNDLKLIGFFKVLNPKGFLANLKKEQMSIVAQDWINVGAQAVVKAKVRRSGNKVSVDFRLYDMGRAAAPVLTKSYTSSAKGVRRSAHRFGDEIVKYFTGDKGIFTSKIAFASVSRTGKTSYIYAMDYDGHGVYRVSRTGSQNILPSWSPGGRLAYTAFLWRNPDVYLVAGSGERAKRISKRQGLYTGAAWSPSGQIALTLSKDGNSEIYVIKSTGEIVRRLTKNGSIDTSPNWSPDGSKIAFVSNRGGSPQIYVMPSSGGSARRLTFKGNYNQEPSWCPRKDTPLIAFTARDASGRFDIFTINAKTAELKRLTQGQGSNKSPSWAPNGRLIVFSSSRGGLWVMNPDGLNQHQIYRGRAGTPSWSWK